MHLMCNYTPRAPGELPMKDWVSCAQLLRQLHPHTLSEEHVKQLITNHFMDHPAFAGHAFNAWNKSLKDYDAPAGGSDPPGRRTVMKFSLEYTPTGASAPTPAPASAAPSTPSALEVSFDVNLEELAVLVDLVDEEAVAALTNHLSDLADEATAAPPPGLPGAPL